MASTTSKALDDGGGASPAALPGSFDLADDEAYRRWRREKLHDYPLTATALSVAIDDPGGLSAAKRQALVERCARFNIAFYTCRAEMGEGDVLALAHQLGLRRLERPLLTGGTGVTRIEATTTGAAANYVPYSTRPLGWHTDGYYNSGADSVRSFVLHCARGPAAGGESRLLDPEIAYIRLRDRDPGLIDALMRPDALTIPANVRNGKVLRPACSGPVFQVLDGKLLMRYTARPRYAVWASGGRLAEARRCLEALLDSDDEAIVRHCLRAGEGIVANNVLHRRAGFADAPDGGAGRLVYRARFRDRVG
ncbi:MAG: TauD/TfdA family dioxygenase [Alphaproteobacteria bacterium]|jgi:hypothetical protein|nr:TauD/TfdA family dioxygenase [Alphaproteobacteria bacterium]